MDSNKYPNLKQALLLILLWICLQFVLALITSIMMKMFGQKDDTLLTIIVNTLTFILLLHIAHRIGNLEIESVLVFKKIPIVQGVILLLTIVGMILVMSEIDNITRYFLPIPDSFIKNLTAIINPGNPYLTFILVVILAPFTEEIIFRGIFLRGFLYHYKPSVSIVLSAFLFAVVHLNPVQFLGAFFTGILLGWLYYKTRSLSLNMAAHALFNGIPILLMISVKHGYELQGLTSDPAGPVTFQPLYLDLTGIGLVVLGIVLLNRLFKTNPK